MSHRRFWLSAAFILFLVGCTNNNTKTTSLDSPVLELNATSNGITWNPVKGASFYEIAVDEETTTVSFPGYFFSSVFGDYVVSVTAVSEKGGRSKAAIYNYETRVTRLGNLQFDGEKITWPGSDYYALEYSQDEISYFPVTSTFIEVEESGTYFFRTIKGFKEQGHVYYGQELNRCIIATKGSPTPYVIEDATEVDDATLNEYYRKMKYTSGWEVTAAYATIDNTNVEYVDGNCIDFHTWYHGMYYMFEKDIELNGSFNEFDFTVKAGDSVQVVLSFQITHTFVVNGIDLNGVYIKYTLAEAPTIWNRYRVSLNDPNWKVNYAGSDYTFSTIVNMISGAGIKVQTIADMFPYFDVFQFRIKAAYMDSGSSAHTYFTDVKLVNSDLEYTDIQEIIPNLTVQESYAFKGDSCSGGIEFYSEDHATIRFTSPTSMELDVTYAIEEEVLTVTSQNPGQDFVATFVSDNGGLTLTIDSVTGTLAGYMANITAESIALLDNFESYTETGVGYDANNPDEGSRTGLRGAYICDYWSGASTDSSPIGGKEWNLMRSTDYLYLSKDEAHTGTQSFNSKNSSNTMRFMSWGLHDGTGKGVRGKYFSFWAKGGTKADMRTRVSVYSAAVIGPSNHVDNSVRKSYEFTIPMNSDWTEYRIELDSSKLYYGFAFAHQGVQGMSGSQRIYIDDIYVYNNLSPWAA